MSDSSETLIENAQAPAKATTDGTSVEQHKLSDQIALNRYLCSKQAAQSKHLGLKITKLVPPGAA